MQFKLYLKSISCENAAEITYKEQKNNDLEKKGKLKYNGPAFKYK